MRAVWISGILLTFLTAAQGQYNGVLGNWTNPTGSTIQIYRCGVYACARVIGIRKDAPGHLDFRNPNPALRKRSLCGLQIGMNFHLTSPDRAEDGELYDPETGKNYTGSMTSEGNQLKLRGYIGIPFFGRTETWTRAAANIPTCHF